MLILNRFLNVINLLWPLLPATAVLLNKRRIEFRKELTSLLI